MNSKSVVAVDLGATNIRVGLVSEEGKILSVKREQTAKYGNDGVVVTNQIIKIIEDFLANGRDGKTINPEGIGIASMGPLNYERGGPQGAPNVPYDFIPLVDPLKERFNLPVCLHNDANAAVLAEKYFGVGYGKHSLVYITLSTGIGGGAFINGNLLLGRSGNAVEVGHFIVDEKYNLPCSCKKGVGHWEGMASGNNLPRFFKKWLENSNHKLKWDIKRAKDIFSKASEGDAYAVMFLDEVARINGRAISDVIVAYEPELITIGGSVALGNKDWAIDGIKKYVDHYLKVPKIEITQLGEDIVLLGAAAGVFPQFVYRAKEET